MPAHYYNSSPTDVGHVFRTYVSSATYFLLLTASSMEKNARFYFYVTVTLRYRKRRPRIDQNDLRFPTQNEFAIVYVNSENANANLHKIRPRELLGPSGLTLIR